MAKQKGEDIRPHYEGQLREAVLALEATGMSESEVRKIVERTLNEARGQ